MVNGRFRKLPYVVAILAVVLMTVGCTAPSSSTPASGSGTDAPQQTVQPVKVDLLISAKSATYLNVFAAQEKGFFKEEGLDVQITYTTSSERAMQTLIGGSGDIGINTTDQIMVAIDKGAELTIVGATALLPPYTLMVQREITSYEQLKGKTFGQSNTRTAEVVFLRALLAQHGLQQDRDYTVIAPGSLPQRVAALRAKAIDGSFVNEPYITELAKDGYVKLGNASDAIQSYQFASIVVTQKWAQKNKDTLTRFLKALIKGTDWVYDPANKDAAIGVMQSVVGLSVEGGQTAYQDYVINAKVYPQKAAVTAKAMQTVMDLMKESGSPAAKASPLDYTDLTYLQAAQR